MTFLHDIVDSVVYLCALVSALIVLVWLANYLVDMVRCHLDSDGRAFYAWMSEVWYPREKKRREEQRERARKSASQGDQ